MASVTLALLCVAVLLATAIVAVALGRSGNTGSGVYAVCLVASAVALVNAVSALVGEAGAVSTATLPLGLPWMGAHFRIDALAAAFLAVVNLGGGRGKPVRHWLWPP